MTDQERQIAARYEARRALLVAARRYTLWPDVETVEMLIKAAIYGSLKPATPPSAGSVGAS